MNDNRLEQEGSHRQQVQSPPDAGTCHKRALEHTEELYQISPVFRKASQKIRRPEPEQWRRFTQELARKLDSSDDKVSQTLRDKISATDNNLVRWFWIILALLALVAIACAIGLSMVNTPTAVANQGKTTAIEVVAELDRMPDSSVIFMYDYRTKV